MSNSKFLLYHPGNSFLHTMNPLVKLFFLIIFPLIIFSVPSKYIVPGGLFFAIILLFFCIVAKCFMATIIPLTKTLFFYAVFLYFFDIVQNWSFITKETFGQLFSLYSSTGILLVRLALTLFCVSLVFATTTSSDFRGMFVKFDDFFMRISRKKNLSIGLLFSLLLTFIPMVFRLFEEIHQGWKIRHPKKSIKKWFIILPCLFSLSFEKAKKTAQSLYNRKLV